jgi:hypothetical protein
LGASLLKCSEWFFTDFGDFERLGQNRNGRALAREPYFRQCPVRCACTRTKIFPRRGVERRMGRAVGVHRETNGGTRGRVGLQLFARPGTFHDARPAAIESAVGGVDRLVRSVAFPAVIPACGGASCVPEPRAVVASTTSPHGLLSSHRSACTVSR